MLPLTGPKLAVCPISEVSMTTWAGIEYPIVIYCIATE